MAVLKDYSGRRLRLTPEREAHILRRPEMAGQLGRVEETLLEPGTVKRSRRDPAIFLYYRRYDRTPVTQKFLLVAAKVADGEGFVATAFFTDRVKQGETVWPSE